MPKVSEKTWLTIMVPDCFQKWWGWNFRRKSMWKYLLERDAEKLESQKFHRNNLICDGGSPPSVHPYSGSLLTMNTHPWHHDQIFRQNEHTRVKRGLANKDERKKASNTQRMWYHQAISATCKLLQSTLSMTDSCFGFVSRRMSAIWRFLARS